MLCDDRARTVVEMWRVLAPGGQLTVAVFDDLGSNQAYGAIADVYEKHVGPDIANALRYPFSMGDADELKSLFAEAGVAEINLNTIGAKATFSSATHLARADIDGWFPFADFAVSATDASAIVADLTTVFAAETAADGGISFDAYAHVVTAVRA